jgi:hypothetical protein
MASYVRVGFQFDDFSFFNCNILKETWDRLANREYLIVMHAKASNISLVMRFLFIYSDFDHRIDAVQKPAVIKNKD